MPGGITPTTGSGAGWRLMRTRLTDDIRIAVELPLPQVVAEDDRGRWHVGTAELGLGELPAEDRAQAEDAEIAGRDDHAAERLAAVGQDEKVERPPVTSPAARCRPRFAT